MRLKDRVAIVTGAARGLGRAYALRLAKEGAKVVVADILDGKETVDAVTAVGGEALYVKTDVTSEESTQNLARKVVERFGRIDILVNNAALFADLVKKPFWEITAGEWDKVMAINLKGPFLCAKAVYPQMKKQGKGKIINVATALSPLCCFQRRQCCHHALDGAGGGGRRDQRQLHRPGVHGD
jgi:NAD(P)-dependent dehydrogenase (short-subunit alcohol dehydrogenase family)